MPNVQQQAQSTAEKSISVGQQKKRSQQKKLAFNLAVTRHP